MLKTPTKTRAKTKVAEKSAKKPSTASTIFAQPIVEDSIAVLLAQNKQNTESEKIDEPVVRRPITLKKKFAHTFSPHIVDLGTPSNPQDDAENEIKEESDNFQKKLPSRLSTLLNEKIHLRDLAPYRSVSPKSHGFGHFPPKEAVSLLHAIAITAERMFVEHPLSELTIGMLLHSFFKVAMWPFRRFGTLPRYDLRAKPIQLSFAQASGTVSNSASLYFEIPLGWRRRVIAFAILAAVTTMPFQSKSVFGSVSARVSNVQNESLRGIAYLKDAQIQLTTANINDAQIALEEASTSFVRAEEALGSVGKFAAAAAGLIVDEAKTANILLATASDMTNAGNTITKALAVLESDENLKVKLDTIQQALDATMPTMMKTTSELASINPASLPESQKESFLAIMRTVPPAVASLNQAQKMIPLIGFLLGAEVDRRYLVVFQNDAELRPTGGFIGSFAVIDVGDGKIKNIEVPGGGSYDLQGSLLLDVASPGPLHLINPKWEFQDANWSPDFPTSARRLMRFHEKSGGPTTEGVVAINASIMEKLLQITGPIEMSDYGKTIDAGNFRQELQEAVELEYDKVENKPKKIIGDLAPKVLGKLLEIGEKDPLVLASAFSGALENKDVQIFLRDEQFEQEIVDLGWAGEIMNTDGDYLAVVHTNIAGQKTDTLVATDILHDVQILPNGSAIVTLTISRTHHGQKGTPFSGVRNVDYLRVYTPLGSTLIESKGFTPPSPTLFEITSKNSSHDEEIVAIEKSMRTDEVSGTTTSVDLGKTVFGNWMMVDPGQTTTAEITYSLPKEVLQFSKLTSSAFDVVSGKKPRTALSYSLLVQPQSGARHTTFKSQINLPKQTYSEWQSGEFKLRQNNDGSQSLEHASLLQKNTFIGSIIVSR